MFCFCGLASRGNDAAGLVAGQTEDLVAVAVQLLQLRPKAVLEQALLWRRLLVQLRGEVEVWILKIEKKDFV